MPVMHPVAFLVRTTSKRLVDEIGTVRSRVVFQLRSTEVYPTLSGPRCLYRHNSVLDHTQQKKQTKLKKPESNSQP